MRVPGLEVFVRQVEPNSYLSVLNEIKEKEYYNLIVDTNPDYMNEFLKGVSFLIITSFCLTLARTTKCLLPPISIQTYLIILCHLPNLQATNPIKSTWVHDNLFFYAKFQFFFLLLFRKILQLQMNEYKYHYFFTSFDIETFDVEDFKYNFVNITAFRLVDLSDIGVKELVKDMERYYYTQNISIFDTNHYIKVRCIL